MDRQDVFQDERKQLLTPFFKGVVLKALLNAPIEFFTAPASASGKYHSEESNAVGQAIDGKIIETGGIIHHSKVVFRLAQEGICQRIGPSVPPIVHDAILSAALLHDILKCGNPWTGKTVGYHGELASMWLATLIQDDQIDAEYIGATKLFLNAVMLHMGRWAILPALVDVQMSGAAEIVANADYIASRKFISVDTTVPADING